MKLINVNTLALEEFVGSGPAIPEYAILSHTWDKVEVTFQDLTSEGRYGINEKAFSKIMSTCHLARRDGIKYAWVDTCCIDKTSSADLTEAINSMFHWYRDAKVCYAWLADLPTATKQPLKSSLRRCRWFTRGWTLQELLAPSRVEFYDQDWHFRGTKSDLKNLIADISQIVTEVLENPDGLYRLPVAQRMSWAAKRQTTRIEDAAYCLLGIFQVNLPMLYGEGQRAFLRLQEEIVKETNDLSIFAWKATGEGQKYHGVLASSPAEFRDCGSLRLIDNSMLSPEFALSNKGLRIETDLFTGPAGNYLINLNSTKGPGQRPVSIWVKHHGRAVYSRTRAYEYGDLAVDDARPVSKRPIYILKQVDRLRSADLEASHRHAFIFRNNFTAISAVPSVDFPFKATPVRPISCWDPRRSMLYVHGVADFKALVHFNPHGRTHSLGHELKTAGESFLIALGLNQDEGKPWITIHGKDDINLLEVGRRNLQHMALMAREKEGQPKSIMVSKKFRGEPSHIVIVEIKEGEMEGQVVYYVDIHFEEVPRRRGVARASLVKK